MLPDAHRTSVIRLPDYCNNEPKLRQRSTLLIAEECAFNCVVERMNSNSEYNVPCFCAPLAMKPKTLFFKKNHIALIGIT